jgi:hypothetical protein
VSSATSCSRMKRYCSITTSSATFTKRRR